MLFADIGFILIAIALTLCLIGTLGKKNWVAFIIAAIVFFLIGNYMMETSLGAVSKTALFFISRN